MEITRRYLAVYPTRFAAYMALECALMRRFLARGGTAEEFCERLAPSFRRRFAPVLLHGGDGFGAPASPRLRQERSRAA